MISQPLEPDPHITEDFPDEMIFVPKRDLLDSAKEILAARVEEERRLLHEQLVATEAQKRLDAERFEREVVAKQFELSGMDDPWAFADVAELLERPVLQPTVGDWIENERSNGGGIFYRGKVNEVHGPSESGKTMFLLAVAAQEIHKGNDVVMIDYEDDGAQIVGRLRDVFGVPSELLIKHLHYNRPGTAFTERGLANIRALPNVSYCIIDAVTEGMSVSGLDGRKENEVAAWYNEFPKAIADLGIAVALVDHTPLDNIDRAIGSQHKKAGIDGVSYSAEPIAKISRRAVGRLRIRVAKDKVGNVRPMAAPGGSQEWRGDLVIDSTIPGSVRVELWGMKPEVFAGQVQDSGDSKAVRDYRPDISGLSERQKTLIFTLAPEGDNGTSPSALTKELNKDLPPDSVNYWERTEARRVMNRTLRASGYVEQTGGSGTPWRLTAKGHQAASAIAEERSRDPQMTLPGVNHDQGFTGPVNQAVNQESESGESAGESPVTRLNPQ